jgi:flagellar FliL protein
MSAAADSPPPKPSRRPLILGLALAPLLGGAGFYASYAGLIPGLGGTEAAPVASPAPAAGTAATSTTTFVPLDPITINLGTRGQARHLRFVAQLEVPPAHAAEVARQMPRVIDVLNTYLRALDLPDLEEPAALTRIRAQMLRRVQLVLGPERVSDLLVMEFVFN